jgi:hypothetical protein
LTNDGAETSEAQIGFTWSTGVSTGGRPILDYRIFYDQGMGNWVELAPTVPEKEYVTQVSIISGQTYKFKVQARNEVGYSPDSDEISILAATIAYVPDTPMTYVSD